MASIECGTYADWLKTDWVQENRIPKDGLFASASCATCNNKMTFRDNMRVGCSIYAIDHPCMDTASNQACEDWME